MLAVRGDATQFRHREVRLGGANNVFKVENDCFLTEKKGMQLFHLSLVWTNCTSPLWNLNVYLFLVWIDNIYGLHLKEQIQILSQNWKWLELCSHGFIPSASWCGNNSLKFHIAKKTDPKYIWKMRSQPRLGWPLWNICVTNTYRVFPRSWLIYLY
jgi:hypothetical protein